MKRHIPRIRNAQHAGRMAGAALVAAGLMFGVGVHSAAAGSPWAPELISAEPVSQTAIRLSYKDRANDEERFNIIYGRDMVMNQRVEDLQLRNDPRVVEVESVRRAAEAARVIDDDARQVVVAGNEDLLSIQDHPGPAAGVGRGGAGAGQEPERDTGRRDPPRGRPKAT